MNNLKKQLLSSATYIMLMILILTSIVFSDDSEYFNPSNEFIYLWDSLPIREDVKEDKVWTIKLKYPVSKAKVNESTIFVIDQNMRKLPSVLTLSDDGKQVMITPIENYKPKCSYRLIILDRVGSLGIRKGVCMPFTIYSDVVKVDKSDNSKEVTLKKGETLQLTLPGYIPALKWDINSYDESILEITDNFDIIDFYYPLAAPYCNIRKCWLFKAVNTGHTTLKMTYTHTNETFNLDINVE